jgi:hypothetical protein
MERARKCREQAQQAQARAADMVFAAHNQGASVGGSGGSGSSGSSSGNVFLSRRVVDLHGLHVQEAVGVLHRAISTSKQHKIRRFGVITGIGNHSGIGGARLQPVVQSILSKRGDISFSYHAGRFDITLPTGTQKRGGL